VLLPLLLLPWLLLPWLLLPWLLLPPPSVKWGMGNEI
jgi:hypothetical protein